MGAKLTKAGRELLNTLKMAADGGAFATACDGSDRETAHELDRAGLADWKGTNWGSSFWTITPAGRLALAQSDPHGAAPAEGE